MLGLGPGMGISHYLRRVLVGRKLSTDLGMDESMVAKNPVRNTVLDMVGSLRTSSLFRYKDLGTSRDLIIYSLVPNKVQIWAFLQVQILFGRCSPVQIVACKREPVSFVEANIGHGIRSQLSERLSVPPRGTAKCSACVGAFTLRGSESRVSDLSDKRMRLDPQGSFQANLSEEKSGVKKMMPKTGVLDPVFNSLPSPETGSMDLHSAGSAGSCASGSRGRVLVFIGAGGHAQADSGVVPHIWDPFLVKTDLLGTDYCARAIAASSDAGVDLIDVGNGYRFRNGKALALATRGKGDKAVLSAETSDVTMLLSVGHVPGSPDPVEDGNDGRLGNDKSSPSAMVNFRTAGDQRTPVNGYFGMATVAQLKSVVEQPVNHGLDAQISRSTNYHLVSTGQ